MQLGEFAPYEVIGEPIFVLEQGMDGDVIYAFLNAVGRKALGRDLNHIRGATAREIFGGRMGDAIYGRQLNAWTAGQPAQYETTLPLPGGAMHVATTLTPVHDAAGRMVRMVGISRDITRVKDLEQAQVLTAAVTSEMQDFVSLAAHDLRSPIANVQALADLIREDFVDMGDGKLDMLAMIQDISERALTLVSDVLNQAQTTHAPHSSGPFDFAALCNDIMIMLDPGQVHHAVFPNINVNADHTAMQIVLRNLIDNALKYAGQQSVHVMVAVATEGDGMLSITVCDNGAGFADPSVVFAGGDRPNAEGGFGLLGICRLVRSRGGEIVAETPEDGRGAQVRFTLPGTVLPSDAVGGFQGDAVAMASV